MTPETFHRQTGRPGSSLYFRGEFGTGIVHCPGRPRASSARPARSDAVRAVAADDALPKQRPPRRGSCASLGRLAHPPPEPTRPCMEAGGRERGILTTDWPHARYTKRGGPPRLRQRRPSESGAWRPPRRAASSSLPTQNILSLGRTTRAPLCRRGRTCARARRKRSAAMSATAAGEGKGNRAHHARHDGRTAVTPARCATNRAGAAGAHRHHRSHCPLSHHAAHNRQQRPPRPLPLSPANGGRVTLGAGACAAAAAAVAAAAAPRRGHRTTYKRRCGGSPPPPPPPPPHATCPHATHAPHGGAAAVQTVAPTSHTAAAG